MSHNFVSSRSNSAQQGDVQRRQSASSRYTPSNSEERAKSPQPTPQAVKTAYFGYRSNYPNPQDLERRELKGALPPPRFHELPLDPKFVNYRGHSRCKWCNVFVANADMDAHIEVCPLVPMQCELRDTETNEPCHLITKGRALMEEHQQSKCPMRPQLCPNTGCGKEVSVQSLGLHLQHCSYQTIRCDKCCNHFARSEWNTHESLCPEIYVECPLGCGEKMRRGDVPLHVHNTALLHKPVIPLGDPLAVGDDPKYVYSILLQKMLDLREEREGSHASGQRSALPSRSRSNSVQAKQPQQLGETSKPPSTIDEILPPPIARQQDISSVASSVAHDTPRDLDLSAMDGLERKATATSTKQVGESVKGMLHKHRVAFVLAELNTEKKEIELASAAVEKLSNDRSGRSRTLHMNEEVSSSSVASLLYSANPFGSGAAYQRTINNALSEMKSRVERVKKIYDVFQRETELLLSLSPLDVVDLDSTLLKRHEVENDVTELKSQMAELEDDLYEFNCNVYEQLWLPQQ